MDKSKKITDKACQLFSSRGARGVSMDDIAKSLGISKKTIYRFFGNKEEIVLAVTEQQINEYTKTIKSIRATKHDAIAELFYVISHIYKCYRQIVPSIVYNDLEKYYIGSHEKLKKFKNIFLYQIVESIIFRGQTAGLFRNNFKVGTIVNFILQSVPVIPTSRSVDDGIHPEEIFDLLVSGITTIEGAEVLKKYRNQFEIVAMSPEFQNNSIGDH